MIKHSSPLHNLSPSASIDVVVQLFEEPKPFEKLRTKDHALYKAQMRIRRGARRKDKQERNEFTKGRPLSGKKQAGLGKTWLD